MPTCVRGRSAGRLCPPALPHLQKDAPHKGPGTEGHFPLHRRLEGVTCLVQPDGGHGDLIAGATGVPARAGRMSGYRGAGGDPGLASTLQLPGVAIGGHRDACHGRGMGKTCLSGWPMQDPGTHQSLPSCEGPAHPQETPTSADALRKVGSRGSVHRGPAPATKCCACPGHMPEPPSPPTQPQTPSEGEARSCQDTADSGARASSQLSSLWSLLTLSRRRELGFHAAFQEAFPQPASGAPHVAYSGAPHLRGVNDCSIRSLLGAWHGGP